MTCDTTTTGWGIAIGAGIGTAIGVATGHVAIWLPIGAALGVLIPSFGNKSPADGARPDRHPDENPKV